MKLAGHNPEPYAAIPHRLRRDRRLQPIDIVVIASLLEFARSRPAIDTTIGQLAADIGRTGNTSRASLHRLEAAGWLRFNPDPRRPSGRWIEFAWLTTPSNQLEATKIDLATPSSELEAPLQPAGAPPGESLEAPPSNRLQPLKKRCVEKNGESSEKPDAAGIREFNSSTQRPEASQTVQATAEGDGHQVPAGDGEAKARDDRSTPRDDDWARRAGIEPKALDGLADMPLGEGPDADAVRAFLANGLSEAGRARFLAAAPCEQHLAAIVANFIADNARLDAINELAAVLGDFEGVPRPAEDEPDDDDDLDPDVEGPAVVVQRAAQAPVVRPETQAAPPPLRPARDPKPPAPTVAAPPPEAARPRTGRRDTTLEVDAIHAAAQDDPHLRKVLEREAAQRAAAASGRWTQAAPVIRLDELPTEDLLERLPTDPAAGHALAQRLTIEFKDQRSYNYFSKAIQRKPPELIAEAYHAAARDSANRPGAVFASIVGRP